MKLLTLIILGSSSLVYAQKGKPSWEKVSRHDSDKDGKVSRVEFKGPDMAFTRFDADKDGFVTQAEMKNLAPKQGGREDMKPKKGDEEDMKPKIGDEEDMKLKKGGGKSSKGGGRPDNAPAAGTQAPKLKAQILNGEGFVDLGEIKKTTVLIFGSHT